ncbi:hypothetical protein [Nonomuraea sp. NPDC049784]|uniref:hypothetical protein n=1 Tax=Nonomuraea sp. NPDC049784 TaxID=3154361 RepID=UPI0034011418
MPRSRTRSNALDKAAWMHHCGAINLGMWAKRAVCGGCRSSVDHAEDVEQYRLVRAW